MARWRFLKAKIVLALAGAFGLTALAVSMPLAAISTSATSPKDSATAVQRDVSTDWNYDCPSGGVCAPAWDNSVSLSGTWHYNEQGAKTAFSRITKWEDFQKDFVTSSSSSYKTIVWSEDTYKNYYLPPHSNAGNAKAEWERIYNELNPKAEDAYAAAVKLDVDALIDANVTYTLHSTNVPPGEFTVGVTKLDHQATLEKYLGTGFIAGSGLEQWIIDALKAGTGLGDVNDYLETAKHTAWSNFIDYLNNFFASMKNTLSTDMYSVADETPPELYVPALRPNFAKEWDILASLPDKTWQKVTSADAALARKLVLKAWSPEQINDSLKVVNLQNKLSELSFSAYTPQSWEEVGASYTVFGKAIRLIDTVDKSFRLDGGDSSSIDDYGPFSVAEMAIPSFRLANSGRLYNDKNPSLSELYDEQTAITGSQLFTNDKTDAYYDGAVLNLLNNVNLAPAFVALVDERVPEADRTPALNNTLGKISNEGLYEAYVKDAMGQIKSIYDYQDFTTFGVLIGVGALMGLVGTLAAYASVRGYIVKRRYGVKAWEYVKSRAIVSAIAVTGVAAAVAMVIAAIIGVV